MPIFRFASKLVLFIHIPKTGGSSIEHTLRAMGGSNALLNGSALGYAKCTPQHMHGELLDAFIPKDFCELTFTVVRDPKQRLLSEYKMRKEKAGLPFDEWVERTFERYGKNPYLYDNHIRPQTEFLTSATKIFRFENGLAAPIAEVAGLIGRPSEDIPQKRKTAPYTPEPNPQLDRMIHDFYRKDYDALGYAPPGQPPS